MVATDTLALEAGRRTPHPGAGEGRGEVVMDQVGDVFDGRAGIERERLVVGSPSRRRNTRISPVRPQIASRRASSDGVVEDRDPHDLEVRERGRSRSMRPGRPHRPG